MANQLPVPVSLILCDDIARDGQKEKFHLVGAFDTIRVGGFPCERERFCAVVLLTKGSGTHTGQAVYLAPNGKKAFGSPSRLVHFPHARAVVWAAFRITRAPLHSAGIYRVQFLCDNQVLTERPFNVLVSGGNGDV